MMFRSTPTVFNRDPSERPLVKLLLHSPSLAERVAAGDAHARALLTLHQFEFAETLLTPCSDSQTQSLLSGFGAPLAEVVRPENHWVLLQGTSSRWIGEVIPGTDYSAPVVPGSQVTWLEFMMGRNLGFDYFVIGDGDAFVGSDWQGDHQVTPSEALDYIRILTVNKGLFRATPDLDVDEGFYYLYRTRILFPEFQRAWSLAAYSALPSDAAAQLASLGQRLEFLARAADKVSYFALQAANNNTADAGMYHLAYMVMLATGIFDDLAWTIRYLHGVELKRTAIGLRLLETKGATTFYKALGEYNVGLHDYLARPDIQRRILMFYPIRDRLQHRQFVTNVLSVRGRDTPRNLVGIDSDAYASIQAVAAPEPVPSWGPGKRPDEVWIEPHWLARVAVAYVAELVHGVLSRIDWSPYLSALSPDRREEVQKSRAVASHAAGRDLGWGAEPTYFWCTGSQ